MMTQKILTSVGVIAITFALAQASQAADETTAGTVEHASLLIAIADSTVEGLYQQNAGVDALTEATDKIVESMKKHIEADNLDDAANLGKVSDGLVEGAEHALDAAASTQKALDADVEIARAHIKEATDAATAANDHPRTLKALDKAEVALAGADTAGEAIAGAIANSIKAAADADKAIEAANKAAKSGNKDRAEKAIEGADAAIENCKKTVDELDATIKQADEAIETAKAAIKVAVRNISR
jgi:hypothetical protein